MKIFPLIIVALSLAIPAWAAERQIMQPRVPVDKLAEARALTSPLPGSPEIVAQGKALYNGKGTCLNCHGKDGSAETKIGREAKIPDMRASAWKAKHSDAVIADDVLFGEPETKMKSYEGKMSAAQLKALVQLIRAL
mgnify:CR=1 FL=1